MCCLLFDSCCISFVFLTGFPNGCPHHSRKRMRKAVGLRYEPFPLEPCSSMTNYNSVSGTIMKLVHPQIRVQSWFLIFSYLFTYLKVKNNLMGPSVCFVLLITSDPQVKFSTFLQGLMRIAWRPLRMHKCLAIDSQSPAMVCGQLQCQECEWVLQARPALIQTIREQTLNCCHLTSTKSVRLARGPQC